MIKKLLLVSLVFVLFFGSTLARAEEVSFADTKSGKATSMFLDAMKQFFEDSKELQGKTNEEKVTYILNKGNERILAKTAELSREVYKSELKAYAEANLRAQLFKEIAIPKISNDYLMKGKLTGFNWGQIDSEIAEKQAAKMRQFDVAVKGIEISINTLVVFYQKGADESLKTLRESIGDELCGWLMPGWTYWRAAQGAVQALGEYVLADAFQSSLDEKVKTICKYDPKTDPNGFAQWLLGLTDIPAFVEHEWTDQIGYDGLYAKYDGDEKTKEEGGAAMKAAIIDTFRKMRASLLAQQRAIDSVQADLAARAKVYDDQAKAAQEKFRSAVAASMDKAKPYLDKIEAFRQERLKLLGDDAGDMVSREDAQLAAMNKSCYIPIDRRVLLDSFDGLVGPWREGKMTPKDLAGYTAAYESYRQSYWGALNQAWSRKTAGIKGVEKGCDEYTLSKAYWVDAAGLDAASNLLFYEACEKLAVLNAKIKEEMVRLKEEADRAEAAFQQENNDFIFRDIPGSLAYPDGFRNEQYFIATLEGISEFQKELVGSGLIMKQYETLQAMKDHLSQEASATSALVARQKAIFDRREQVMMAIENRFNNIVPEALRANWSDGYLRVQHIDLRGPQRFSNTVRFANVQGVDLGSLSGPDERYAQADVVSVVDVPDTIYRTADGFATQPPVADFGHVRSLIDAAMARLASQADQDALRLQGFKLSARIHAVMTKYRMDGDAKKVRDIFSMKNGQKVAGLDPVDSDGAAFLNEIRDVWEKSQPMFAKIDQLLTQSHDASTRQGIEELKKSIQDNIKFYEGIQKEAKVTGAQTLEEARLKKIQDEFAAIKKEMDYKKLAASLETFRKSLSTQSFSFVGSQIQTILAEVLKLQEDVQEKLDMAGSAGGGPVGADKESKVVAAVTGLANAYEKNDISGFSGFISRDFLGNKAALEEGARFDFSMFNDIRLSLNVNRIMEQRGMMVADIRWSKTQAMRHGSGEQTTNGITTMAFVDEDGVMKLKSLKGNLIFATLSTDIAQASGLGSGLIDQIRAAYDAREPKQPGAASGSGVGFEKGGSAVQAPTPSTPSASQGGVRHGVIPQLHMGFDFSTGTATSAGMGDFTLLGGVLQGQGGAQIREAGMDFSSITQAPASGYNDSVLLNDNTTYCFITKEGYYGKMKIGQVMGISFAFDYVLQTDGSRNLAT